MFPSVCSNNLSDLGSAAQKFTEAFTFRSDEARPGTEFAWITAYTSQNPVARTNYINRTQDEHALKAAVGKTPALVLEDKFSLPARAEDLYKENFLDFEVQIWPEVGISPFSRSRRKTRGVILAFVKRVSKVRPFHLRMSLVTYCKPHGLEDNFGLCRNLSAVLIKSP
jgi:hypothetical protein